MEVKKTKPRPGWNLPPVGIIASCIWLSACAAMDGERVPLDQTQMEYQEFLRDDLFPDWGDARAVGLEQFFALPPSLKDHLSNHIAPLRNEEQRYMALRDLIHDNLADSDFDTSETLLASELLDAEIINCLSFSSLFIAAARELGLDAHFQLVDVPPYWDGDNDTWVVTRHVNVYGRLRVSGLSRRVPRDIGFYLYEYKPEATSVTKKYNRYFVSEYVADMTSGANKGDYQTFAISDEQALALFLNNKAGEALQRDELDLAYGFIKEALRTDSSLSPVWNTLGAIYQREGNFELAASVYEVALNRDSSDYAVKTNLVNVYNLLGKDERAESLERELAEYRQANPYYHYRQGERDLLAQDLDSAAENYRRAVALKHDEALFYHGLAKVQVFLGQYSDVEKSLLMASLYANDEEKRRFTNKLTRLHKALGARVNGQVPSTRKDVELPISR